MSRHVSNNLKRRARELAAREGLPYSAALARLRTPSKAAADQPAVEPAAANTFEYLYVALPLPDLRGARPCEACLGTGREPERPGDENVLYFLRSDDGRPPLGVEAACTICFGCGRAEHDQVRGCGYPHVDPWMEPDGDEDEDESQEPPCLSCRGAQFNYMTAFPEADDGQAHDIVIHLRVPCGCTEDQASLVREVAV